MHPKRFGFGVVKLITRYLLGGKRLGIITAYRSENSHKQNERQQDLLKKDIRAKGLGFLDSAVSRWTSPDKKVSVERPLLIDNAGREVLDELASKYGQYSYLMLDGGIGYEYGPGESTPYRVFKNWKLLSHSEAEDTASHPSYTEVEHRRLELSKRIRLTSVSRNGKRIRLTSPLQQ